MRSNTRNLWLRLSLALTIVAGALTTGLLLLRVQQKVTRLHTELSLRTQQLQQSDTKLAKTLNDLAAASARLDSNALVMITLTAEKEAAQAAANDHKTRAERFQQDFNNSQKTLDATQAALARYKAAGMDPDQILFAARELKSLTAALATATEQNNGLKKQLERFGPISKEPVILPPELKGKVAAVDAKWNFIIVDAGEKQGVRERGEVLVSRHGRLIARATISRVQLENCVADIAPGWTSAEIEEGDEILPMR